MTYEDKPRYAFRFVYDLAYKVGIKIVILQIIFGIIIDTFADLRGAKNRITEILNTKCFMCGIEKQEFERKAEGGFNKHIKIDHHIWNYMFYVYKLNEIDADDYDGIETYVSS